MTDLKFKTKISRNMQNNIQAETCITLEIIDETKSRELSILTSKRYDGLVSTSATVSIVKAEDTGWSSKTHAMYSDFYKTIMTLPKKRVTEKLIAETHETAMSNILDIVNKAKIHYNIS